MEDKKNTSSGGGQARKRRQRDFLDLYEKYSNDIFRFVYFKVKRRQDAEDLTSKIFLNAWNASGKKDLRGKKARAFLYAIARNAVIDHYRSLKNRSEIEADFSSDSSSADQEERLPGDVIDEKCDLNSEMDAMINNKILMAELEELGGEEKEIIILRYINELTYSEISQIIGRTSGNIRVICHRTLKVLKEKLKKDE
jgi:RNA polymerase sigma-70 factor (ECF subfamily)